MNPKIRILAGESLYSAINKMKLHLSNENLTAEWLDFNGINLLINKNSVTSDIQLIYDLKCEIQKLTK